jgi:hypothetical protein
MAGGVVVLFAGGLGLGLASAAVIDDTSLLPRVLGAALATPRRCGSPSA